MYQMRAVEVLGFAAHDVIEFLRVLPCHRSRGWPARLPTLAAAHMGILLRCMVVAGGRVGLLALSADIPADAPEVRPALQDSAAAWMCPSAGERSRPQYPWLWNQRPKPVGLQDVAQPDQLVVGAGNDEVRVQLRAVDVPTPAQEELRTLVLLPIALEKLADGLERLVPENLVAPCRRHVDVD